DQLNPLLDSLRTKDLNGVEKWMNNDHWQTFLQLLQIEFRNPQISMNPLSPINIQEQLSEWSCPQCTYLNIITHQQCDMCSSEKK
ncbi:unnamed protein product, partial [Adineta steineri]